MGQSQTKSSMGEKSNFLKILENAEKQNSRSNKFNKKMKPSKKKMADPCCFCYSIQPKKKEWRNAFTNDCKQLEGCFEWADSLPLFLKEIPAVNEDIYLNEVLWIAYLSNDESVENSVQTKEKRNKLLKPKPPIDEDRQPSLFGKPETHSVIEEFNFNNSSMEVNTAKFGLEQSGDKVIESPTLHRLNEKCLDTENSTTPTLRLKITPAHEDKPDLEMLLPTQKLNSETSFWSQTESSSLEDNEKMMIHVRNNNAQNLLNNTVLIPNGKRLGNSLVEELAEIKNIYKYKSVTSVIEKHLGDQKNPLCQIRKRYTRYYVERYEKLFREPDTPSGKAKQSFAEKVEDAFSDLKQFIRILKDAVIHFYNLNEISEKIFGKVNLFSRDNLLNFVCCIIFSEEIYDIVYRLQREIDRERETRFTSKLLGYRKSPPEAFGILEKLRLNEETAVYLKSLREQKYLMKAPSDSSEGNSQNKAKKEEGEMRKYMKENEENLIKVKAFSTDADRFEESKERKGDAEHHDVPFCLAIDCLKNIQFCRSPIHKIKVLIETSKILLDCIEEFYAKYDVSFDREIEPDDLMPIFLYIIAKSEIPTLITQCNIIDKFITDNVLISIGGYYFTTLHACVHYIENQTQVNPNPSRGKVGLDSK